MIKVYSQLDLQHYLHPLVEYSMMLQEKYYLYILSTISLRISNNLQAPIFHLCYYVILHTSFLKKVLCPNKRLLQWHITFLENILTSFEEFFY